MQYVSYHPPLPRFCTARGASIGVGGLFDESAVDNRASHAALEQETGHALGDCVVECWFLGCGSRRDVGGGFGAVDGLDGDCAEAGLVVGASRCMASGALTGLEELGVLVNLWDWKLSIPLATRSAISLLPALLPFPAVLAERDRSLSIFRPQSLRSIFG